MKLLAALSPQFPCILTAVGGGGKTSLLFALAQEAADQGRSVLITTTTAMFNPETFAKTGQSGQPFHRLWTGPAQALADQAPAPGTILVGARDLGAQGKKLLGYGLAEIRPLLDSPAFDLILIEGDGARMRPVKAPASHEPVIPPQTSILAGCIGLDCLGLPLDETQVHRPELLTRIAGQAIGSPVTEKTLISLIRHDQGLFKACPAKARTVLVLNKADTPEKVRKAQELIQALPDRVRPGTALVTCLRDRAMPVRARA